MGKLRRSTLLRAKQESNAKNETSEDLTARIEKEQEERRKKQFGTAGQNQNVASILAREIEFVSSDSEGKRHDCNDGASDGEWEDEHSTTSTTQSYGEERSESPDSGNVSGGNITTSPLHSSAPKAEKLPVPPKSADSQTEPQASPAITTTNEEKEPPTSSVKSRCEMFGRMATGHEKRSVVGR